MRPSIKYGLIGAVLLIVFIQGIAMNKPDKQELEAPDFEFTEHCVGRYQLELPADMKLITSGCCNDQVCVSLYPPEEKVHDTAYYGENRVDEWRSRVEDVRKKEIAATQYVVKSMEGDLKTLVYYADHRKKPGMKEKPDRSHIFETFMLKDFPNAEKALAIGGQSAKGVVKRDEPNYKGIFRDRLTEMQEYASQIEYQPWPHNRPGICLNEEFVVAKEIVEFGRTDGLEGYHMEFFNGKHSIFEVMVGTYADEASLKEELGRNSGLMAFLASTTMKVAGRKGRLFISDGKYSETEREFRWVSTDTKVGSINHAHLEISGKLEMEDYPEMAPMKATKVIMGLLKSIQMRPYGFLDAKR